VTVITTASTKGGVGKTVLSFELSAALGAVLIDLDWHAGGATRMWGFRPLDRARAPLLDGLDRGPEAPPPRPRAAEGRPDLVPSHPALASAYYGADRVADCLAAWAETWGRPVWCDTAPGANELTHGALMAAQLVVVPAVLHARELDALEEMVDGLLEAGHRVLVVPTMVRARVPPRYVERLEALVGDNVGVAPAVSEWRRLPDRGRRRAIVLDASLGAWARRAAAEFRAVAAAVNRAAREEPIVA
jgi:chromosome partitioning protein